jgi:membrane-bound lytic murein transglycosylase D
MRITPRLVLALLPLLLLAATGCETVSKKKKPVAAAPVQVVPPPPPAAPPPEPVAEKPPAPPPSPPPAPQPDPAEKIIAQSEAAYQAGVEAYRSGHLERAKREFDRAVDLLLTAPDNVRSDERFKAQLEKLVDQIHGLEVVALKEGDGFTERRTVPAPLDEIAELTFPPDPKLKEKVEREVKDVVSDLPLVVNDYVLGYVNYFTSRGKGTMENGLRRAGRYRDLIFRVFKEEGGPQDLIYLAQAESAFQPGALSRAGARGMWQFMASRGREYDLNVGWWADERQDPEKATRAAARHLKDLYAMFGDWYLAMAAYNSGPVTVERAIERTGYADFWELYQRNVLPRETRNYVPIILATTIVAKNPEKYGFDRLLPDPPILVEAVRVSVPTDLRLVAETIDCSLDLIQGLNPSLLRITTPRGDFDLKLPLGTKGKFLEGIARIPEDKRVFWRWHRVAAGESLQEIARKYKTTAAAISEVNTLPGPELQAGAKLVIPVTTARDAGATRTVRLRYRVRRGDTVERVANRFGVLPQDIRKWNRISGDQLAPGRILVIQAAQSQPAGATTAGTRAARKPAAKKQAASKSSQTKNLPGSSGAKKTSPASQTSAAKTTNSVTRTSAGGKP